MRTDPFSTGGTWGGWVDSTEIIDLSRAECYVPRVLPHSWLLRSGWQRAGGRISPWETPGQDAD